MTPQIKKLIEDEWNKYKDNKEYWIDGATMMYDKLMLEQTDKMLRGEK